MVKNALKNFVVLTTYFFLLKKSDNFDTMTKSISGILEELRSFRSKLYEIDIDDQSTKQDLNGILEEFYGDYFEPFAEEYLITGYDIEHVSQ